MRRPVGANAANQLGELREAGELQEARAEGNGMEYQLDRVSQPVVVVPHQDRWQTEFREAAAHLRRVLGDLATRIDHIGSTSVLGLAAKDIIDIQVTVPDIDNTAALCGAMIQPGGYRQRGEFNEDHVPVGADPEPSEWRKLNFRESEGARVIHVHVREHGRLNQRYALLFRDYLRSDRTSAKLYEQVKTRLALLFPQTLDAYLYIKDPACDLIMQSAERWSQQTAWEPGASDA
jgi:GrpB-like predicted nucleotidyltransferase (UPF0157 family)